MGRCVVGSWFEVVAAVVGGGKRLEGAPLVEAEGGDTWVWV